MRIVSIGSGRSSLDDAHRSRHVELSEFVRKQRQEPLSEIYRANTYSKEINFILENKKKGEKTNHWQTRPTNPLRPCRPHYPRPTSSASHTNARPSGRWASASGKAGRSRPSSRTVTAGTSVRRRLRCNPTGEVGARRAVGGGEAFCWAIGRRRSLLADRHPTTNKISVNPEQNKTKPTKGRTSLIPRSISSSSFVSGKSSKLESSPL